MADILYWTVVITAPTYLVLQLIAFVHLDGPLRASSIGLAVFMAAVVSLTIDAYTDRSNVWPAYVVVAGPPAALVTAGLLAIGALLRKSDGR